MDEVAVKVVLQVFFKGMNEDFLLYKGYIIFICAHDACFSV